MDAWSHALLMGYDQVREHEDSERELALAGAKVSKQSFG